MKSKAHYTTHRVQHAFRKSAAAVTVADAVSLLLQWPQPVMAISDMLNMSIQAGHCVVHLWMDRSNILQYTYVCDHSSAATGADVNQESYQRTTSPLLAAASGGHLPCLQQLLEWGADASYSTPLGFTPLMAAVTNGYTNCVDALLACGADVNSMDLAGLSSIMLAASVGDVTTLQCLIRHGADVERMPLQVMHKPNCRAPRGSLLSASQQQ